MNEIILNKKISIERCIKQIRAYYAMASTSPFEVDHLRQDAIAMNLQRIAESSIDIANYLIKKGNWVCRRIVRMPSNYCIATA